MAYTDSQFAQLLEIIANAKLFSELLEQTTLTDDGFFTAINTGTSDAKKIKIPLLRGFNGDWNATTNTPTLINGTGLTGSVYRVSVAGTLDLGNGSLTYGIDEIIYYNSTKWVKLIQSQISDILNLQSSLDDKADLTSGNTFTGNQSVTGDVSATGQGSFGGDVKVTDKLYSAGDILTLQSANGLGGSLILNDGADTLTSNFDLFICASIKADIYKLKNLNTAPASATDWGVLGDIRYTADYIYVCTATNTWKRVAISTW